MKTFEEFYKDHIDSCAVYSEKMTAKWAWEAATLAERERCANICEELHWSWGPKELANAIRNPNE